jgi:hypothetical protein
MTTAQELARAKNMDLLVNTYNLEVSKINMDGFIDVNDKKVKQLKNTYDNLRARLDTDKNTIKHKDSYRYKIKLDSKKIVGLRGLKQTIRVRSDGR